MACILVWFNLWAEGNTICWNVSWYIIPSRYRYSSFFLTFLPSPFSLFFPLTGMVALFPGLTLLWFLIACSMQEWRGEDEHGYRCSASFTFLVLLRSPFSPHLFFFSLLPFSLISLHILTYCTFYILYMACGTDTDSDCLNTNLVLLLSLLCLL